MKNTNPTTTENMISNEVINTLSENELIQLAKQGNRRAEEQIIKNYDHYCERVAGKYAKKGSEDFKDYYNACSIGIWNAIHAYDEQKCDSFIGYARYWVLNELMNRYAENNGMGMHDMKLLTKIQHIQADFLTRMERLATNEEILDILREQGVSITLDRVIKVVNAVKPKVSLDSYDDEDENGCKNYLEGRMTESFEDNSFDNGYYTAASYYSTSDTEAQNEVSDTEEIFDPFDEGDINSYRTYKLIDNCVEQMSERRRECLFTQYPLDGVKRSVSELAKKYNVSTETIRLERIRGEKDVKDYVLSHIAA